MSTRRLWTCVERKIIETHYPTGGTRAVLRHLPPPPPGFSQRTEKAIQTKAAAWGIKGPLARPHLAAVGPKKLSPELIAALKYDRQHWPKASDHALARMLGVTHQNVRYHRLRAEQEAEAAGLPIKRRRRPGKMRGAA